MWKIRVNSTWPDPQPDWPEPVFNPLKMIRFDLQPIWLVTQLTQPSLARLDPTRPDSTWRAHFAMSIHNYQDAMAICWWASYPHLFLTFTCNLKWPEIVSFLELIPGQKPEDWPDIVARAFKIKLDALLQDIKKVLASNTNWRYIFFLNNYQDFLKHACSLFILISPIIYILCGCIHNFQKKKKHY